MDELLECIADRHPADPEAMGQDLFPQGCAWCVPAAHEFASQTARDLFANAPESGLHNITHRLLPIDPSFSA